MPTKMPNLEIILTPRRCLIAATILYSLMIGLGSVPGNAQALSATVSDKLLHFFAYAALSALVYGGMPGGAITRGWCTTLAIGALGALDEAIQSLMPYREASWLDWQVDMLAALSCVSLLIMLTSWYQAPDMGDAEADAGSRTGAAGMGPEQPK